jgi:hypothetical protein
VGFVVDKVALGHDVSEHYGIPACSTLIIIYYPGLVQ